MLVTEKNNAIYVTSDRRFSGLSLVDVGAHQTPPLHMYGPAVREYYLIHFIVGGRGTYLAGGKAYPLSAGDCFLIRPLEVTTYRSDEAEPWNYVWIGFTGDDAESLVRLAFGERRVSDYDRELVEPFMYLLKSAKTRPDFFTLKTESLLFALLASVHRPESGAPRRNIVDDAVRYIETNYFRPFDITQLSRELGMSRSRFTTVFTEATGMSPYRYLTVYRIDRAAELFRRSAELTVTEAACSVGFSGVERFSEMFKKYKGVPPLQFRNGLHANPDHAHPRDPSNATE